MNDRRVFIGVSGGIAAFNKAGAGQPPGPGRGGGVGRHDPRPYQAHRAQDLRGPHRPARGPASWSRGHPHIEPAAAAEVLWVGPATANVLAKAACGLADDLLSTILLVRRTGILAPAMNDECGTSRPSNENVAHLAPRRHADDPEEGF